ncbi:nucleoside monophosphate kinase, partial [bacterium]|nr:nucleoside monophosphate kinase [bacterium]
MKKFLLFLGAPGSGKGTQAQKLQNKYGICQISTGDLLREVIARKTDLGKKVANYVHNGELVPDEVIVEIVKDKLAQDKDIKENGFILDGFPRTVRQADLLRKVLQDNNMQLEAVVFFEIDLETIVKRILGRLTCAKCGKIYNSYNNLPAQEGQCDVCGGKVARRVDDTEEK